MKTKILLLATLAAVLVSTTSCSSSNPIEETESVTETAIVTETEATKGVKPIKVKDVVGITADKAEIILEEAGFKNLSFIADSSSKSDDIVIKSFWTVIAQTPSSSKKIDPDEEIILTCKKNETEPPTEEPTEKPTEKPTEEQVLSSSQSYSSTVQQITTEYVLNTSTMKVHHYDCRAAKRIAPENYDTAQDLNDALAQGYEECKICFG